jgi:organic hydroperoxide reductase OsmC/OhrA
MKLHPYALKIEWTGNDGQGTERYDSYRRDYTIVFENKPPIFASADSIFRGDSSKLNPEEMLLSALSSCHMLWFLHECADHGVVVVEYFDNPKAFLEITPGKGGRFSSANLGPIVTVLPLENEVDLQKLHEVASQKCFIANSCNFPIKITSKHKIKI